MVWKKYESFKFICIYVVLSIGLCKNFVILNFCDKSFNIKLNEILVCK